LIKGESNDANAFCGSLQTSVVLKRVDLVIIRELVSGIYFGEHEMAADESSARDVLSYTVDEIR
jgi:3-isopropylmalate dehydrogenase